MGESRGAIAAVALLLIGGACSSDDRASNQPADTTEAPAELDPRGSDGCGTSTVATGEEKVTLQSGDVERWYLRHVPPAHDGEGPVPVVIDVHGYSEGAEFHRTMTQLGELGDEQGFVTLTPHGAGPVPFWNTSADGPDVAFMGEMLDDVESSLCVDLARIYVTGLSNGAMMTSSLACAMSDRIAAAAPVAGATEIPDCSPERAVPAVAFHGTDDPFLRYEGGYGPAVAQLPDPSGEGTLGDLSPEEAAQANETVGAIGTSVPDVMAGWAERNGCDAAEPDENEVADDVTLLSYGCPAGAEVELYRVEGGGHTWPGSHGLEGATGLVGTTTFSISANEVMWEFFQDHPLAVP